MGAAEVRQRHETALMALPNVIGVAVVPEPGRRGEAIVVYVSRKVPRDQLGAGEAIPDPLEGVPVHVIDIGQVSAQPDIP